MKTERLIETVGRARRGDENALTDLYLDAYRSVYYLALRMVKNPEDAEDITQEVFITVQQKIKELREPAAFYAWVNQITANKCNRLLSKYKGIAQLDDEAEFLTIPDDDPLNLPDKAIDDEATRKIIMEVIDNLPDNQRACVLLFYYAQFTVTQIADTLETNENTVKSRLALARSKIRAALMEKEKKEGIKLYGIPLALTPILRQAMEQFIMPEGAEARMWENIQNAVSEGTPANGGGDTGTGGAASTANTSANAGMTLTAKIILGVVAAAVITAGAVIIPRLMDSPTEATPPPAVTATTPTPTATPGVIETTEPTATEQADEGRAPAPIDLRFEVDNAESMVYWYVAEHMERVAGFEFAAAPVGSDDWTPLVTVPADYGGYPIEQIAAYLTDGEYRIRLMTQPNEGFTPSEPVYIETGTLTVRTGDHPKISFTVEKFDNRFVIHGFDEHLTLYFMDITRNGVRVDDMTWFDTNWRADIGFEAIAFENGYGGSQPGDIVILREHIETSFDGTGYTVTFAEPSDPITIP